MAVAAAAAMAEATEAEVEVEVDRIIPVQIGGLITKQISSIHFLSHPDYKELQENNFVFSKMHIRKGY